jgi:hypothetical protein
MKQIHFLGPSTFTAGSRLVRRYNFSMTGWNLMTFGIISTVNHHYNGQNLAVYSSEFLEALKR